MTKAQLIHFSVKFAVLLRRVWFIYFQLLEQIITIPSAGSPEPSLLLANTLKMDVKGFKELRSAVHYRISNHWKGNDVENAFSMNTS